MKMNRKEKKIFKKVLPKAKISRISEKLDNDYFIGVDRDYFTTEELETIERFIMIRDYYPPNLEKYVVIFPKDIMKYYCDYYNYRVSVNSSILALITILVSIVSIIFNYYE